MKEHEQNNALELTMLPLDEQARVFNDEFLLADNFGMDDKSLDLSSDDSLAPLLASPYPFKMRFTIILFCLEGTMRLRYNLSECLLQKDNLLLVLSGSIGQCLEVSPDFKVAIIAFSEKNFVPEPHANWATFTRENLSYQLPLEASPGEMEEFLWLYRMLRRKIEQPDFRYKRETIVSGMQLVIYNICQLMLPYISRSEQSRAGNRKKQIYEDFMQLLAEHYASERSIGFYAGKLCLSPKYLSQVVYSVSGRHAADWIRDYVILEAKALLKSGRYNIQQVSDLLNFPNQSFFGVYFKKEVGCSPRAYQDSE